MTKKADIKKALQAEIDKAWAEAKQRIADMQAQKDHPQIALCIEKNKGYAMAMEDVVSLLYSHKIF
jgi:hypothetical protein